MSYNLENIRFDINVYNKSNDEKFILETDYYLVLEELNKIYSKYCYEEYRKENYEKKLSYNMNFRNEHSWLAGNDYYDVLTYIIYNVQDFNISILNNNDDLVRIKYLKDEFGILDYNKRGYDDRLHSLSLTLFNFILIPVIV